MSIHNAGTGSNSSNPGTKIGNSLNGTIDSDAGNTTYTASGITLNGGTVYFVRVIPKSAANRSIGTTTSDVETGTGGWSTATIANTGRTSNQSGVNYTNMSSGRSLRFTVNATGSTTLSPPTLNNSVLQSVRYTGSSRAVPAGSAAWNESYAFTSGTNLRANSQSDIVVTCTVGTAEIGWYKSTAPTTRLGTTLLVAGVYVMTSTPTAAGEYRALAYCKSGSTYSSALNLMRGGAVTLTSTSPTLTAGNLTQTGARLTIANHSTAWWYKGSQSGASCTAVAAGTSTADLTSLTANTSYTYKAYSASGCASANEIASETFRTTAAPSPTLTASGIGNNGARLVITNHTGAWWYKGSQSGAQCTARAAGITSFFLTSLTANTSYTYKAYSASGCASANEIASVTFRTAASSAVSLSADMITASGARLTIVNYATGWWYKGSQSGAQCTSVNAALSRVSLTGLSAGTRYTYKAYSGASCTTEITTNATDAEFVTTSTAPPGDTTDPGDRACNNNPTFDPTNPGFWLYPPRECGPLGVPVDRGPKVSLSAPAPAADCPVTVLGSACVAEGAALTLTATLERALAPARAVTVPVTLERDDAEAADVGEVTTVNVRIPAGATSGTAQVRTHADGDDADDHFWLKLSVVGGPDLPDGVDLGVPHTVYVTISDPGATRVPGVQRLGGGGEDGPPVPSWARMRWDGNNLLVWWAGVRDTTGYGYTVGGGTPFDAGNRTWTSIGGLDGSGTPAVRIHARTGEGTSAASDPAVWWPPAPAGIGFGVSGTDVTLSWGAVSGATKYRHRHRGRAPAEGGGWGAWGDWSGWTEVSGTSATIGGLTAGNDYAFEVETQARLYEPDGALEWSPKPATATETVPAATAPQQAQGPAENAPPAPSWVRMRWDGDDLLVWWAGIADSTGYAYTRDTDGTGHGPTHVGNRTWARIAGLDKGGTHLIFIWATSAQGASDASGAAVWWPPKPASASLTAAGALTWEAVAGAHGYRYRVKKDEGAWGGWTEVAATATSATLTGLAQGAYTVEVGTKARLYEPNGNLHWSPRAAVASVDIRPALSVADATAAEGAGATLDFAVTLAPAVQASVTVAYATSNGTAAAGSDYTAASGTLTFAAGETSKTVSVAVLDDAHDEGSETLTLTLSNASGAAISDAEATGTITNADPLQKDWLARFGRAAAADAIAAVTARLETPRDAGSHFTLGGQRLPFGGTGAGLPPEPEGGAGSPAWLSWSDEPATGTSRTMSGRELLMGTSFRAVLGGGAGSQWTSWGQGASVSAFSSTAPGLSLSGETATGSLGMDYEHGRLLTGFAMTHSLGEGTASGAGRSYVMGSSVTTMLPYARYALSERVSAWGLAGTGTGRLTLDLDGGAPERYGADLAMTLAAVGVRGELMTPAEAGGFALAVKADGFWVRTESESVSAPGVGNLAGARADASRLRAVLDGSRSFALADGGTLTPSLELGVRHDGGDAETGTGTVLGAGLGYADPSRGLDMAIRVQGLAAHAEDSYREWSVSGQLSLVPGGAGRGLTASLTPSYGVDPGDSERLWTLPDASGLAANGDAPPSSRLDGEVGYGMAVFGGGFTGTPNAGFGLSDTAREVRMGWRLTPAGGGFELNLDAARREAVNDDGSGSGAPEHRVGFGFTARW